MSVSDPLKDDLDARRFVRFGSHRAQFAPRGPECRNEVRDEREVGPLRVSRLAIASGKAERGAEDLRATGSRRFQLVLQLEGNSEFFHCGNESRVDPGDVVLIDSSIGSYWKLMHAAELVVVEVEPRILREYLPAPEQFCGRRLAADNAFNAVASIMIRAFVGGSDIGMPPGLNDWLARRLLELVSMAWLADKTGDTSGTAVLWQRRSDVLREIENRLRDPELNPASLARELRLSPRYLRTIFSVSGETISAYILRRRVDACACQIRNPDYRDRTLTEIAFSWGFNSAAHFTRSFHDRFGMPPREYRQQHMTPASNLTSL